MWGVGFGDLGKPFATPVEPPQKLRCGERLLLGACRASQACLGNPEGQPFPAPDPSGDGVLTAVAPLVGRRPTAPSFLRYTATLKPWSPDAVFLAEVLASVRRGRGRPLRCPGPCMKRSICLSRCMRGADNKPVGDISQATHAVSSRFKQAKSGRSGLNTSVCHGRLRLISATPRIPRLITTLVTNRRGKPPFALKSCRRTAGSWQLGRPWRKARPHRSTTTDSLIHSC